MCFGGMILSQTLQPLITVGFLAHADLIGPVGSLHKFYRGLGFKVGFGFRVLGAAFDYTRYTRG